MKPSLGVEGEGEEFLRVPISEWLIRVAGQAVKQDATFAGVDGRQEPLIACANGIPVAAVHIAVIETAFDTPELGEGGLAPILKIALKLR